MHTCRPYCISFLELEHTSELFVLLSQTGDDFRLVWIVGRTSNLAQRRSKAGHNMASEPDRKRIKKQPPADASVTTAAAGKTDLKHGEPALAWLLGDEVCRYCKCCFVPLFAMLHTLHLVEC